MSASGILLKIAEWIVIVIYRMVMGIKRFLESEINAAPEPLAPSVMPEFKTPTAHNGMGVAYSSLTLDELRQEEANLTERFDHFSALYMDASVGRKDLTPAAHQLHVERVYYDDKRELVRREIQGRQLRRQRKG